MDQALHIYHFTFLFYVISVSLFRIQLCFHCSININFHFFSIQFADLLSFYFFSLSVLCFPSFFLSLFLSLLFHIYINISIITTTGNTTKRERISIFIHLHLTFISIIFIWPKYSFLSYKQLQFLGTTLPQLNHVIWPPSGSLFTCFTPWIQVMDPRTPMTDSICITLADQEKFLVHILYTGPWLSAIIKTIG